MLFLKKKNIIFYIKKKKKPSCNVNIRFNPDESNVIKVLKLVIVTSIKNNIFLIKNLLHLKLKLIKQLFKEYPLKIIFKTLI